MERVCVSCHVWQQSCSAGDRGVLTCLSRILSAEEKRTRARIERWRFNPGAFAAEAVGLKASNQQREGFDALRRIFTAKWKRARGEKLTEREEADASKIGITIRSGRGTGKDAWLAVVSWWMLQCFKNPKLAITATSQKQITDVFWSEMAMWGRSAPWPLMDLFSFQSERVYFKGPGGKENHFSVGPRCERKERRCGSQRGSKRAARSRDVADGGRGERRSSAMAEALEATLTGSCNMLILIGNMLRSSGYSTTRISRRVRSVLGAAALGRRGVGHGRGVRREDGVGRVRGPHRGAIRQGFDVLQGQREGRPARGGPGRLDSVRVGPCGVDARHGR